MTVNDRLTTAVPRDPWAAHADEPPTTATEIIAVPRQITAEEESAKAEPVDDAEKAAEADKVETPDATGIPGGPLPPAPPAASWQIPAGKPKRSPKVVLLAAVLVTAIASSGITAGIMTAIGGDAAPAATTQNGSTGGQGGPGGGFGGGPGGGMRGGGGMPGGAQQDSGGQPDSGTTQQDPGTAQPDSGATQQDATTQQGTTGT
ncbi:hypothetical protein Aph02nite_38550 [Actinoplanes philippinensis]|uniref:Uncharacterized protein n=1 Tax=Actinoplanes philippinensis TaxID=35752 RepID=A0A1I2FPR3_9ACTN|nr:hypothetical protein [Actinoplanes philippinensis]GIE77905.1 hypothetical protein Aph02nite_38550 [Actinoplanes philippinensis]SFF06747.1 hypothetical protein SAMN05421541_105546 [Actinoplanes philippinensis]